jgi:opacity protein-like surface antigen
MEILMKRFSTVLGAILAVAACGASTAARADNTWNVPNPLGFYVGAGVGESTIRSDDSAYGLPGYYNDHETAWKGIVGFRPIGPVGVEAEWIDFGQPDHHRNYDPNYSGFDSHPRAAVLYGLGYLPIPLPYLDIYAKAGVARLETTLNAFTSVPCTGGANGTCYQLAGSSNSWQTKFAYGAGVSSRLPLGFTVRAEYERISSPYGDPDAFTVSALWRF